MKMALDSKVNSGINLYGSMVNNLRFADDTDIIAESNQDLQDVTDAVYDISRKMGPKINREKTKVMAIGKDNAQVNIKIGLEKLQQIEEFTCLGAVITSNGSCQKGIA